jgi:two-component system response regulator PilR (NtrC family)
VPLLTRYFLRRKGAEMKKPGLSFSPEALAALERYPWPGNVRELANVVERALVLESGEVIGIGDLPADVVAGRPHAGADPAEPARPMTLDEAERRAVLAALTHTGWKKGEAAKLLDVSWPTLNKKIEKFGLKPPGG